MSDIKGLLEKWSQLEPQLCKRETHPNKDWHEEFEDYKLTLPHGDYLVYSDKQVYSEGRFDCWSPNKEVAMAMVQWAVQQAIIEKRWLLKLEYDPGCPDPDNPYDATVQSETFEGWGFGNNNLAEALLIAYLETLEAK